MLRNIAEKRNNIVDNLRNMSEKMTQLSDSKPNKLRFQSFRNKI